MEQARSATDPDRPPGRTPGSTARLLTWARARARGAAEWSVAARETHRSVDVGFRLADRDRRVAAGVLAGGIAYRLFFWVLSVSVLSTGALGAVDRAWVDETLSEMGLDPAAAESVEALLRGSDEARWWIILVAGGWSSGPATSAPRGSSWSTRPCGASRHGSRAKQWVMSLAFSGTAAAFVVAMSVADWVQARGGGAGLVALLVSTMVPFALWLTVTSRLPHRGAGWKDLVPGALLVGIGIQAIHQFTIWFLAPKMSNATQLYGLLGVTATALFWFYILGRLIIGAATLNASLCEQRSAAGPHVVD